MTLFEADMAFEELVDKALSDLSPRQFAQFLVNASKTISNYEDISMHMEMMNNSNYS